MIGPVGSPEDSLSVSSIQTSVGKHIHTHTHAQLTRLSSDPLGRCCRRFPSFPKGESENCHFIGLLSVFLQTFLAGAPTDALSL